MEEETVLFTSPLGSLFVSFVIVWGVCVLDQNWVLCAKALSRFCPLPRFGPVGSQLRGSPLLSSAGTSLVDIDRSTIIDSTV